MCANYFKVGEIFQTHMNTVVYLHVHTAEWSILFFMQSLWFNESEVYQITHIRYFLYIFKIW